MNTASPATSTAASPLFKLPAELRLRTYEYVLYINLHDGICEVTRKKGILEPALLFTCKTVSDEGIAIFYSVNTVRLIAESFHPAVHNFIARKVAACKTAGGNLRKVDVETCAFGKGDFWNLTAWVQFLYWGKRMNPSLVVPQGFVCITSVSRPAESLPKIYSGLSHDCFTDTKWTCC
jgi:hypothetical protein